MRHSEIRRRLARLQRDAEQSRPSALFCVLRAMIAGSYLPAAERATLRPRAPRDIDHGLLMESAFQATADSRPGSLSANLGDALAEWDERP